MGLRFRGRNVVSMLLGGTKQSSDHESDRNSTSKIVTPGEPSRATEGPRNTGVAQGPRNEISNDDDRSTPTSILQGDATNLNIVGSGHEAREISPTEPRGFFKDAHRFTVMNSMMVDKSTNIITQVASDRQAKGIKLLSKHMIPGAAHNSFSRDPPPRCHPGTRIQINGGILSWFYDEKKQELVLWIYGPAGVGKSAIVRTIAEGLAKAKCLGASVFFSRPNGRNNSRAVFITIAYQLAVNIKSYCAFICDKLASDPQLVNGDMKEQFNAFIVEPFGEKAIGADGNRWGILLDGLDELDDHPRQREIIVLITTFVFEHPDAPLVWIIASRPEPHITITFKSKQVVSAYSEESVPIDSPEAYQDVERYLRSSFKTMHENLPHIVPPDWPEEMKFAKLAHASSGLFAFADVAVRYIEDPKYTDPVTRLDDVLSVIDRSRINSTDDQPFAHLDAMYTRILSSVPSKTWLVTRRVLGVILWTPFQDLASAKGIAVILDLELSKVYASINELFSVLNISLDDIYSPIEFRHASLSEFLEDVTRSKEFFIPSGDIQRDIDERRLQIWLDFKGRFPQGPKYPDRWSDYASHFHSDEQPSADMFSRFDRSLFMCILDGLFELLAQRLIAVQQDESQHHWNQLCDLLHHMDAGFACHMPYPQILVMFWFENWKKFQEGLTSKGIVREIRLEQLPLGHLEWQKECPKHFWLQLSHLPPGNPFGCHQRMPSSPEEFDEYISGLKHFQKHNPGLQVLVCGTTGGRYAVFIYQYSKDDFGKFPLHLKGINPTFEEHNYYGYYCIPYSDNM